MPGELFAYTIDMAEAAVGASQTFVSAPYTTATTTTPMAVKSPADFNLGAFEAFTAAVLTATASQTAVSAADLLDEWLGGYEVTPGGSGATALKTVSRQGATHAERVLIQPPQAGASYNATSNPFVYGIVSGGTLGRGQTPATFTASGTRTDNSFLVVPAAGGTGCYVRWMIPAITGVYAASVTVSLTITLYAFSTITQAITAVEELDTDSYKTATVDLATKNFPDDMTPLGVVIMGAVFNAATITRIQVQFQGNGATGPDFEDVAVGIANQALGPVTAYGANDTSSTLVWLYRQRCKYFRVSLAYSTSTALALLYFDIQIVPPVSSTTTAPAATPAPNAVKRKGEIAVGGNVVARGNEGAGTSRGNRGGRSHSRSST